jgi:hypothetical protein
VNNILTDHIQIHCSVRQGWPLAPDLHVLSANSLGYLLESTQMQGSVHGIPLLDSSKMVHNHFVDDFLLVVKVYHISVEST